MTTESLVQVTCGHRDLHVITSYQNMADEEEETSLGRLRKQHRKETKDLQGFTNRFFFLFNDNRY